MEDWIVAQQAEMYALYAELCGMVAENTYRESRGHTIAYGEDAFYRKADEMRAVGVYIMQNRR